MQPTQDAPDCGGNLEEPMSDDDPSNEDGTVAMAVDSAIVLSTAAASSAAQPTEGNPKLGTSDGTPPKRPRRNEGDESSDEDGGERRQPRCPLGKASESRKRKRRKRKIRNVKRPA